MANYLKSSHRPSLFNSQSSRRIARLDRPIREPLTRTYFEPPLEELGTPPPRRAQTRLHPRPANLHHERAPSGGHPHPRRLAVNSLTGAHTQSPPLFEIYHINATSTTTPGMRWKTPHTGPIYGAPSSSWDWWFSPAFLPLVAQAGRGTSLLSDCHTNGTRARRDGQHMVTEGCEKVTRRAGSLAEASTPHV
jgi:hypothetical protein